MNIELHVVFIIKSFKLSFIIGRHTLVVHGTACIKLINFFVNS